MATAIVGLYRGTLPQGAPSSANAPTEHLHGALQALQVPNAGQHPAILLPICTPTIARLYAEAGHWQLRVRSYQ